jgi:hypothetical protein
MTAASFALVLLTSGYVFMRLWQLSRSHLVRSEGHTLYFLVVWAAFILGLLSITVCHDIIQVPWLGDHFHHFVAGALGAYLTDEKNAENVIRFGTASLVSIPLSLLLGWAFNIPLRQPLSLCPRLLFRISSVTELECFLWDATSRSLSVMITLSGGKVYIGNAVEAPAPGEAKTWVRIEPLLSGYRTESHEFKLTTSYFWIHTEAAKARAAGTIFNLEDFDVFVPIDGIESVHFFDIETYEVRFHQRAADPSHTPGSGVSQEAARPEHRGKHRITTHPKITPAEWIYLVYIFSIAGAPFLFYLQFNWAGVLSLLLALFLGYAFVSAGKAIRQLDSGANKLENTQS